MINRALPIYERDMNEEQLEVIRHEDGPIQVVAGAGSGKTRALVHRIMRLIDKGVSPREILAVTFTRKARDEMNSRLVNLGIREANVRTWHSLCLDIVTKGQTPWARWHVDRTRWKQILKDVLGHNHLKWTRADPGRVESFIGLCKANLLPPNTESALNLAKAHFDHEAQLAANAYSLTQDLLCNELLLPYDDLIVRVYEHFTELEQARAAWAGRWRYILQDEAQDANLAQHTIGWMLAREHRNYMIVGDSRQGIYSFRGSRPELFVGFAESWGAKVVGMNSNYRSLSSIVAVGNAIIRKAEDVEHENMIAMRPSSGSVNATLAEDLDGEASNFVSLIRSTVAMGGRYSDVAALYRTNAQNHALEEALLRARIPYVIVGGASFYERKEVKDLLAYLRVATGEADEKALKRCINAPFRYLSAAFTARVSEALSEEGAPDWPSVVREAGMKVRIKPHLQASANEWARLIYDIQAMIRADEAPGNVLLYIVQSTNYLPWLTHDHGEERTEDSHTANIAELIRMAWKFNSATDLLEYIDETTAAAARNKDQAGGERVVLMTIHGAKGLEWSTVFVAGCNEGLLPHPRGEIEEERRLMYVAVTRARDVCELSYVRVMASKAGIHTAEPSRFLRDAGLV